MTAWTDFVREYAAKHNVSYKTAMSQASETYKNRGTTQVKRNVAQRGLADIASIAKKGVETKAKEAEKVRLNTTEEKYGVSPELVNDYMYYQPMVYGLTNNLQRWRSYRRFPADIRKEIDKIEEVNEQFMNFFKDRRKPDIGELTYSKFPGVNINFDPYDVNIYKNFDRTSLVGEFGIGYDYYDEPVFKKNSLRSLKKFRSDFTKLFKEYNADLKSSPITLANMKNWKLGVDNRKKIAKSKNPFNDDIDADGYNWSL